MVSWAYTKVAALAAFAAVANAGANPFPPTIAKYNDSGAVCSFLKASPKDQASISLYIDNFENVGDTKLKELTFPVLILKYTDIVNFTNLLPAEVYNEMYSEKDIGKIQAYDGLVNFETNKFDLKLYKDYKEIDDKVIFNDYIALDTPDHKDSSHVDINFKVDRSGLYCVYIAPPTTLGLSELTVPITFKNPYGTLPYVLYVQYTQQKWLVIIGLAIFAYLFNYILRFKVGDDFSNLNSISLISRTVVFYVLIPYIILAATLAIIGFFENRYVSSRFWDTLYDLHTSALVIFTIVLNFFICLFAMGYGVVYYHRGNSRNYRMIPKRLFLKAKILLYVNLAAAILLRLFALVDTKKASTLDFASTGSEMPHISTDSKLLTIIFAAVASITGIMPFIWFIVSLVYYFKTKKVINTFPPSTDTEAPGSNSNEKTLTAFRRSILVIFVLPIATMLVIFPIYFHRVYKMMQGSMPDHIPKERETLELMILQVHIAESIWLDTKNWLLLFWAHYLNFFILVILIYFIWIKENNGLIVDPNANDPIEYADVAQYEISDDEGEATDDSPR
ncbi:uncharacterized protein RJT20DRAFT_38345 [Scheffersomyces xylosifermentans]|uniref:uncharacterized protein n=1 Tax=Scheffersomyces xylosifermentans TaxID=1304137 RepID=UPI00315CAC90